MIEYKVNEAFQCGNEIFKAIKDEIGTCHLCDLGYSDYESRCRHISCNHSEREDNQSVIFILLDSTEPDEFDLTGKFND